MKTPHVTQKRYLVEEDHQGKLGISSVEGQMCVNTVKTPRVPMVRYVSRMQLGDWNKLAASPEEAVKQFTQAQLRRLETAHAAVQYREQDVAKAVAFERAFMAKQPL